MQSKCKAMQSNFIRLVFVLILSNCLIINKSVVSFRYAVFRSQTADVPPAQDGTDGTSGYLISKTSRSLSDSTASREQKRKVILSEQDF